MAFGDSMSLGLFLFSLKVPQAPGWPDGLGTEP